MVASTTHELSSYQHIINVAAQDDYQQTREDNPHYYGLSPFQERSCYSNSGYLGSGQTASSNMAMEVPQVDSTLEHPPMKRKTPSLSYHDGGNDDIRASKSIRPEEHHKKQIQTCPFLLAPGSPGSSRISSSSRQNHSEIEKRRRDKMNTYITELSAMVPMCHAMSRKLDKLTVLRMAVQHMKTIRGAVQSYTDGNYKPSFISDLQLKQLIKQAAEGFLFVVGCDRGRILYVSESVTQALNYSQTDLLGQSWFDILHPKDVAKVKEQLSSSHLSPRERYIDAKTMLPVKTEVPQVGSRLSPGARRSFFCRMKCKSVQTANITDSTTGGQRRKKQDKKYKEIHCTGYLKPWAKLGLEEDREMDSEGEASNLSCLVAMGRVITIPLPSYPPFRKQPPINIRPLQFISRHAMDGKFLFVDQRATLALGFLPQELLGTSMYEYYYKDDITDLADVHKTALNSRDPITTKVYRFRRKDGSYVQIQSEWKSFRNPWTKEGEYMIAKNSRITAEPSPVESCTFEEPICQSQTNFEFYRNSPQNGEIAPREISRFVTTHVEASNIGRKIADEIVDEQRRSLESPLRNGTHSPAHILELQTVNQLSPESNVTLFNGLLKSAEKNLSCSDENCSVVRNNVSLTSKRSETDDDGMLEMIGGAVSQVASTDGNDEAAMAVIMSLLEADAGLGGPVDYTGLPWPLS